MNGCAKNTKDFDMERSSDNPEIQTVPSTITE